VREVVPHAGRGYVQRDRDRPRDHAHGLLDGEPGGQLELHEPLVCGTLLYDESGV
jgi:hypothetical protein